MKRFSKILFCKARSARNFQGIFQKPPLKIFLVHNSFQRYHGRGRRSIECSDSDGRTNPSGDAPTRGRISGICPGFCFSSKTRPRFEIKGGMSTDVGMCREIYALWSCRGCFHSRQLHVKLTSAVFCVPPLSGQIRDLLMKTLALNRHRTDPAISALSTHIEVYASLKCASQPCS